MNPYLDISWLYLGFSLLIIIIPIIVFIYFKTGLAKTVLWSFFRMVVQLLFVGFYLKYFIEYDILSLNIAWVVIMIIIGSHTVVKRAELNTRYMTIPLIGGFLVGFVVSSSLIGFVSFAEGDYFTARLMIPISGMLIGNSLSTAVVGVRSFYRMLKEKRDVYYYNLMNSADKKEALFDFTREAMRDSFNPMLANIGAIGLIWIPGTMTGQIIAGSNPMIAIKYQLVIVLGYFTCCTLAVLVGLVLSRGVAIDEYGVVDERIFE